MAKRITKLSKLSKSEVKQLMKKLADNELKPIHIKGADGVDKNGVLFHMGEEEVLVILDSNSSSNQEFELLEKELEKITDDDYGSVDNDEEEEEEELDD